MKKKRVGFSRCLLLSTSFLLMLPMGCTPHQSQIVTREKTGITLSVLAGQSTADAGVEDMINEVIAEKFPDITLEWECVDWGTSFASQIRGRFVTGDIPDILVGKAQDVASYVKTGNLAPIPEECIEQIRPESLEAVTKDGKVYGLPYNVWYQGVLYNKDIFKENGLPIPNTKEELDMVVSQLEQAGITPYASHFQESWKVGNMTMQYLMNEVFNKVPDWGDRFRKGEVNFSDSEVMAGCLKNNQQILEASWDDALMIDQSESDIRFAKGEAAMYLTGSWSLQFIYQAQYDTDIGIFPFPNEDGNAKLILETNMTFLKSSKTKYSELVDEIFIELATNRELAENILAYTQSYPALKNTEVNYITSLQRDIDQYQKKERVIDVSLGNSQLIWEFQNSLATKQLEWLKGQISLEEVLKYADENRKFSAL